MKKLWQWVRDPSVWRYAVFGALTTMLNYAVYFLLFNGFGWSAALCNTIAWLIAVLFAFVTNKQFVFCSKAWTWQIIRRELAAFLACRVASGSLETLILLLCVDIFHFNGILWKLLSGGLVVLLNYFGGKLLVFCKKD